MLNARKGIKKCERNRTTTSYRIRELISNVIKMKRKD